MASKYLVKWLRGFLLRKQNKALKTPWQSQEHVLLKLVKKAKKTRFGKAHDLASVKSYQDFKNRVPIRDYEAFRAYIEPALNGKTNVFWPDRPLFWAKTSGTTSGVKYIPISKTSINQHITAARNLLINYALKKKSISFLKGKMIFLQGSPTLEKVKGIKTGRLSGIVAHYVPWYLKSKRLPSWKTNTIEDWEAKIEAIVLETINQDLRLISGIPPWLVMYFEKLIEKAQKPIGEIFPNLSLLITGGVAYAPYQDKIQELIGQKKVDVLQTYPASEGFFAYQQSLDSDELSLLINDGIFFEFIPMEALNQENPLRLGLSEVEIGVDYALIITNEAGLWAYSIGDVVRFTSLHPPKIKVTGRVSHFISAFGEHVIAYEVEHALEETLTRHNASILEFTVAPQVTPSKGLPYHEWFIDFAKYPQDLEAFTKDLDLAMRRKNAYYDDLISGKVLRCLILRPTVQHAFRLFLKQEGKLGGQNKMPRLSNDRKIADRLFELQLIQNQD